MFSSMSSWYSCVWVLDLCSAFFAFISTWKDSDCLGSVWCVCVCVSALLFLFCSCSASVLTRLSVPFEC